ncbi:MAG: DNA-processing protein DprA [Bacteroidetes bacterium]|nr:DNA-processing protein DprA [Bacteroidota bacterium]MDA1120234.1 DNA-processing protein DprA [Bacteroidota bacterium]
MKEELLYRVALNMLPGIGSILAKQLLSYCGSVDQIFKTSQSKLEKIPGIGPKTARLITASELLTKAADDIENCLKNDVEILFYTDKEYPYKLKQAIDCPTVIYTKGTPLSNSKNLIAIVGTRRASDYGKAVTKQIVKDLQAYDVVIVSGLAYGIDITAHKASIENDIETYAVLGSGVDVIYPALHKDIAKRIEVNGALISEYPLGTKPEAYYFPARNRIIAGLVDAVIVVEAAERGGALITADIANSYNREVFAVPGNINLKGSDGCNNLIRQQKAAIFTSVEDMVKELNWDIAGTESRREESMNLQDLTEQERLIVDILLDSKNGIQIDQLAWKSQLTVNQLAGVLLSLEFSGIIKSLPGKKYQMKSRF